MEISGLSAALSNADKMGDVGTLVLGKSLDEARQQGSAMTAMIDSAAMELSVNPAVGSNFDMRI